MIYVTSSEFFRESLCHIYILCLWFPNELPVYWNIVWHMVKLLHCPFYCRDSSRFFSFLSAEKKGRKSSRVAVFVWLVHGVGGGIWVAKRDGFLMVFWSNKFRFSKRFLGKPTVKCQRWKLPSEGLMGQWREFQSNFWNCLQFEEHPVLRWVACQTTSQKLFKIIHYDFFLSKVMAIFLILPSFQKNEWPMTPRWFQIKTIIKPQQPSKVTSVFLPEFFHPIPRSVIFQCLDAPVTEVRSMEVRISGCFFTYLFLPRL